MNIYNLTYPLLEEYFTHNNENKAKAKIIYNQLYKNNISDFSEINNLSSKIVKMLKNDFSIKPLSVLLKNENKNTVKILFCLEDGNTIEAVLLKHHYGNGLCISTQVGCNMGCAFCESGRLKKVRDLNASEMVLQVLGAQRELNIKITHLTLMGIGEPFDNYNNVIDFIDIINNPHGFGIANSHITVSTCGIVPEIKKFIKRKPLNNIAVSLHAPDNELRNSLMPINKVYNIENILEALKPYSEIKNKKITFEYIMLKGINDSIENAVKLCALIKNLNCYVNLIPYNETNNTRFQRSEHEQTLAFYDILKKNRISVTIRHEMGADINAACGQLRQSVTNG